MGFKVNFISKLNNCYLYRQLAYRIQKWSVERNPMNEINRYYIPVFGKKPNLKHPHNLIEKIYWMQLHCDTSKWTLCADKYRMREYVKSCGYEVYLPKLYGVWYTINDFTEEQWERCPSQFVIKANNGCGTVLMISDKSGFVFKELKRILSRWMSIPYGYRGYQPHYLGIKPCFFAEELLSQDEELQKLSPKSIVDYKIWCFNGHVESILVVHNRTKKTAGIDLFDASWNHIAEHIKINEHFYVDENKKYSRPDCLEEMKNVASKLSKGFPQMRVDFYIVNGKPVIGELTMATGYGYFTEDYYNHMGDLVDVSLLPKIR